MNWIILSLIAVIMWGIWGFLAKLVMNFIGWKEYVVASGIGSFTVILITYLLFKPGIFVKNFSFYLAFLTGVIGTLPTIFFYLALTFERASIIVPLTSTYPIVTVILSILILKESITLIEGVAIILVLIGMLLLSLKVML
jgi:transporter family protein